MNATTTGVMLTSKQLAERWHTTTHKLANDRCAGSGLRYTKPAGRVLYRLEDVEQHEKAAMVETYGRSSFPVPV